MNQLAEKAMNRTLRTLYLADPFVAYLALQLNRKQSTDYETGACDGTNLFYNPDFFMSLSEGRRKFFVAHEAMHFGLQHSQDMQKHTSKDPMWANVAMDLAINSLLVRQGDPYVFIEGGVLDHKYDDWHWVDIYNDLDTSQPPGGGNSMQGDVKQPADGAQLSEVEAKQILAQARTVAKLAGKLSAAQDRWVEEMLAPRIDWRTELLKYMVLARGENYSWQRPNKRYIAGGLYLPSYEPEPKMPPIAFVVDTSGSISNKMLNTAWACLRDIVTKIRPEAIHLIPCDYEVYEKHHHKFTFADIPKTPPSMPGGGGTAFEPAFTYIGKNLKYCACIIYLSDLHGPLNFDPPTTPTIWLSTTSLSAPFGKTIRVNENESD